jgi:hypothetical protein
MKFKLPVGLILRKVAAAGLAALAAFVLTQGAVLASLIDPSGVGLIVISLVQAGAPVLAAYLVKESKLLEAAAAAVPAGDLMDAAQAAVPAELLPLEDEVLGKHFNDAGE